MEKAAIEKAENPAAGRLSQDSPLEAGLFFDWLTTGESESA